MANEIHTIFLLFSFTGCKKSDSEECKALETVYTAYNKLYNCAEATERQEGLGLKEFKELKKKQEKCVVNFKKIYNSVPTKTTEQMTYFHHFHTHLLGSDNTIQDPPPPKAGQTTEEVLKSYPFHLCVYKKLEDKLLATEEETVSGEVNIEAVPAPYPSWDGEPPYYDVPPGDIPPPSGYVVSPSVDNNSGKGFAEAAADGGKDTFSEVFYKRFKECLKELGDKEYQENKKKFNCQ